MKRFFTFSFILLSITLFGQNLIPDGSAENYLECPSNFGDIETWLPTWQSFRGSPDYFNSCSSGLGWDNDLGYQEPRTGEGYVGLVTFSRNLPNAREYIGVNLTQPLLVGQEYFLTFYVSRAHQSNGFNAASNNIGALFLTENNLNPEEQGPIPNFSTFNEIEILEETISWVEMSYQFIADSAYQFLGFGNFYDDSLTDTLRIGGEPTGGITTYYYFDDFCLTTMPNGCDFVNSTRDQKKGAVTIYPNPCNDRLYIEHEVSIEKVEIYSLMGKLLVSFTEIDQATLSIDLDLPKGLYFLTVYSKEQKATRRFMVSN
jgi:hypothetical protein